MCDEAYIAGLFDGEGTVSLFYSKNRWIARVSIANTNKDCLEFIRKKYPTSRVVIYRMATIHLNWKTAYRIELHNFRIIRKFLLDILPWLIIKRKQAELMLEYITSRTSRKQEVLRDKINGRILNNLGKAYLPREVELGTLMTKLNMRGNRGVSSWA